MIVVDSSALVAIFEQEMDAAIYAKAIQQADRLIISAVATTLDSPLLFKGDELID